MTGLRATARIPPAVQAAWRTMEETVSTDPRKTPSTDRLWSGFPPQKAETDTFKEKYYVSEQTSVEEEALRLFSEEGKNACRNYLTEYTVETGDDLVSSWWGLADGLMVSFANGGIYDPVNGTTTYPGYPDWWYQEAGYQYGPRIYDVEALDSIVDVVYTNETVYVQPGTETEYIRTNQTEITDN